MQAELGRPESRVRTRMWLLTAAMVVWAGGYLAIILAQGSTQDWWLPGWFVAMALIPAAGMVIGLRGKSPRWLVVATATLASWGAILGVLGLVSLIGAPLILVGALAYQLIPALADGQQGRPDRAWARRRILVCFVVGLVFAFAALVTAIIASG